MNKFAERLKDLRLEKGLSQSDLARENGMSTSCINMWEKALRIPNIDSIIVLVEFFCCTSDYLIGIED